MSQYQKRFLIDVPHVVLYNPIDRDSIIIKAKKTDIKKRKFTICSVGSLTEVKRFDRVIRLAKKLKDDGYDIDFWIIGDGLLRKELLELVSNLGLNDMVHFLGFINPPYPYIRVADILLLTSKAEGFPLVLCEALCLGVPVIATACTGPIEILDRGKYGVLCNHDDDSIYLNVKSLIDDKTKLEAYAFASEKRSKMFNIHVTMQNFYDIIDARSNDFGV
jgi:glycosyltransferase involved in cell wall biosynthesis